MTKWKIEIGSVNGSYATIDIKNNVYYEASADVFCYEFTFFKIQGITKEMATAITDEIVLRMIDQSYDHGSSWRESNVREIVENDFKIIVKVYFRVRDAG